MSSYFYLLKWPIKKTPRLALPFFILLAALLHLSTIYLFNIVYQPSHVSKPLPAQIFFLPPHSPSAQQMICWLAANDPSIFSPLKTIESTRLPLPASIYEPGPASLVLRPLPALEKKETTELPSPTDEPVLPIALPNHRDALTAETTTAPAQATMIQLSDPLAARLAGSLSTPWLSPEISLPLPPTKLTLNIDAEGIPRHVIVAQSCGNASADEIASRWAMTIRFASADHDTWGGLLVIWGNH